MRTILLLLISFVSFGQVATTLEFRGPETVIEIYGDGTDGVIATRDGYSGGALGWNWATSLTSSTEASTEVEKVTKSGRKYISDFKSNDLITIVYLSGSGQFGKPLSALRSTPFYKLFYLAYKDKYNFFMPMQYAGSSGWEKKIDGLSSGAHFIQEMIDMHGIDKIAATGHSAGGTYATAISLAGKVKGFAPVAGGSLDITGTKGMSAKGIQLFATHGDADRGGDKGVNGFAYGSKAVRWYTEGGGKPIFNVLPGVGHGSDVYAYKPSFGMAEWFDSLFEPVIVPPKPGIYVDGVWAGTDSCTVDEHLITLIK